MPRKVKKKNVTKATRRILFDEITISVWIRSDLAKDQLPKLRQYIANTKRDIPIEIEYSSDVPIRVFVD